MRIKMQFKIEHHKLLQIKKRLTSQLRSLPEGSLRIKTNGNHKKWYRIFPDGHAVYIKKGNRDLAAHLALKKHLSGNLASVNAHISFLETILEKLPEYPVPLSFYEEEFQNILEPYYERNLAYLEKWLISPFPSNTEYPEGLIVPTKSGVMVRSKSEAMIANELFECNVPFHYEQKLVIGETIIYPDFTIPGKDERDSPFIWEHFGMVDKPNYILSATSKLKLYIESGYIPGVNLIMTFEKKDMPLDIIYVDTLISHFFGDLFL